jgi:hypothetical protein
VKNSKLLEALILAGMTTMATAQTNPTNGENAQGGGQGGSERRGPPPQAIEACKGKSSGAPCSFVGHNNNQRTGTCFSPNADRSLACRPAGAGNHHGGQGQGTGGHE